MAETPSVYLACVPHVPFLETQHRSLTPDFWRSYDARVAEFQAWSCSGPITTTDST